MPTAVIGQNVGQFDQSRNVNRMRNCRRINDRVSVLETTARRRKSGHKLACLADRRNGTRFATRRTRDAIRRVTSELVDRDRVPRVRACVRALGSVRLLTGSRTKRNDILQSLLRCGSPYGTCTAAAAPCHVWCRDRTVLQWRDDEGVARICSFSSPTLLPPLRRGTYASQSRVRAPAVVTGYA